MKPSYNANLPDTQFGGRSGGGTDLASHTVISFIEYCKSHTLSFFVLFVDLVKAFDRVLREITVGFPSNVDDPDAY